MSYTRNRAPGTARTAKEPAKVSKVSAAKQARLHDAWVWSSKRPASAQPSTSKAGKSKSSLEHPGLSLADDAPTPTGKVKLNSQGTKKGYDPYDSGRLGHRPKSARKDLRKLGEWLNLRKQVDQNKNGEE